MHIITQNASMSTVRNMKMKILAMTAYQEGYFEETAITSELTFSHSLKHIYLS